MNKILVFTATYNEVNNVEKLIKLIFSNNKKIKILVIDDNSPDNTFGVLKKLKKKYGNMFLIKRPSKLGLDTAHKYAFKFAQKNRFNKLITMDADLSHDPKVIKKLINKLNNYDFVIGSRYVKGGSCEIGPFRYLISFFGNKLIKVITKIPCNEFTTSYRGFNLKKMNKFNIDIIKSKGYSFFMETIYQLYKHGIHIHEIPIKFKNRTEGKSKISKIEIFRTLKNLLLLRFSNNRS